MTPPIDYIKKLGELKVTVPLILVAAIAWAAYKADDFTSSYLSEFFLPRAEAQEIANKVEQLEEKINAVDEKLDMRRIKEIETEVFNTRVLQCGAEGTLRTKYAEQIATLLSEWRGLNPPSAPAPELLDCDDVR